MLEGRFSLSFLQVYSRAVVLKVLHRNFMGGDDFLGQASLPLQDFDVDENPMAKG